MKATTKKGILAGMVLETMSEDQIQALLEQELETKPSRLHNKKFKQPKNKKKRAEDYDNFH